MKLELIIVPYQKFVKVDEILVQRDILHSQTTFYLAVALVKTEQHRRISSP